MWDEEALKATVNKKDYRQYTLQYYKVSNQETSGEETKEVSAEQKQTNLTNMQALQEKAKTAEDFTKLLDDNDKTGILCANTLKELLRNKYEVFDEPPKKGKDHNDYLCIQLGIYKSKERSYER